MENDQNLTRFVLRMSPKTAQIILQKIKENPEGFRKYMAERGFEIESVRPLIPEDTHQNSN